MIVTEEAREEKFGGEMGNGEMGESGKHGGPGGEGTGEGSGAGFKVKKIAKKKRDFQWKHMWLKQENAIKGSKPIWLKRWVRVKTVH